MLVLTACGVIGSPEPIPPAAPGRVPSSSLQLNTFPPLKYNGASLRFRHYGLEEGLSQSSVLSIVQDRQGFLWFGTQDGLNRFDGYSFTVFRPNPYAPNGLSGGEILSMALGADGSLWIGTSTGLNRYDPLTGDFKHWTHNDRDASSLINDAVQALYQDPSGSLWVGTHGGLDEFDPATGKFKRFDMLDKPGKASETESINALFEDSQHVLWIGTNDGLVRYGLVDHRFERYRSGTGDKRGISFDEIASISPDPSGVLWIGTHVGLDRLDPSTDNFTAFVHSDQDPTSLADDYVQSTYVDRAGQLWIGTRNGLDRFDPANQQFFHYQNDSADPDSLSSNAVEEIYEDRGGNLWIGTFDGGLNERDRSQDQFAYYHHVNGDPNSLSGDVIFPIVPAATGKIWIGTYDAGLNLFDPATGRSERFRHDPLNPDSLLNDTVISLLLDKDNTLWIGTRQGMDRLLPASTKFVHYVNDPQNHLSIPFGTVYKIYQDRAGTYYIGTARGLRIFDPVSGRFNDLKSASSSASALADGPVMAIFQDQSGMLWFGTDGHGLFRYDPGTMRLKQYVNDPNTVGSLSSNSVLDVNQDSRGVIWISTFGGGLDRYVPAGGGLDRSVPEGDSFMAYRQKQGLPNDVVYGTVEDNKGNIWVSTNLGISRLDLSTGQFDNFTVNDGLQSNEFDSSSVARDQQGRLYFGGVKGLTVFDPADIKRNPYIPPLVITSLTSQDGKPLGPASTAETWGQITIAYPQNSFDLSFAALSFSQIDKNQYKYMLDGFDQSWHNIGSDHRGSYTNLPGGTYTLRVIGSNSDGIWNNAGTSVTVTVVPPFWQTWEFRGLAALVVVLAASLAYRSRVDSIQAQKTALEHLVLDRTQALKKQNLDLQALYSADEKMLRVLSRDEVLQALVDVAVDTLQADKSAVFMEAAPSNEYMVQVSRGFRPETVASPEFARSQQSILRKAAAGEALLIHDTATDPAWNEECGALAEQLAEEGARSLLYIPIKVQDAVLGILTVCSSSPGTFDEDRQRLFGSLVQRAALSIENNQLFERTKRIAVLEERNRMAQELHDSAKQKAFAALAQLGAAKRLAHHGDGSAGEHVDEAENIVSEVIHDLTYFIQESYPDALKDRTLANAMREDARAWESRSGVRLQVSIASERPMPRPVEEALYRIVQEGLSNIARHSRATQANLDMAFADHEVRIRIADNGIGFDRARIADGLGLRLVRERLARIGGQIDIQSASGRGTVLTVRAPVE